MLSVSVPVRAALHALRLIPWTLECPAGGLGDRVK
jgi:hypothetical protein